MSVVTIKLLRNFLQRWATRLYVVEVNDQTLDDEDDNVDEVELPGQVLDADGIDVLVEDAAERREAEAQREPLGADLVRKDLNGVGDCEARPCQASDAVEEEYHGEDGGAGG